MAGTTTSSDSQGNRESRYKVPEVDFRGSWPVAPGLAGRPSSVVFATHQYAQYKDDDDFDDGKSLTRYDTTDSLVKDDASFVENKEIVLGSTEIYDKNGNLRLIPVCSRRPTGIVLCFR